MSDDALHVDIPNEAGWPPRSVDSLCSLISRGTAPVYVEHSDVLAIGQRCVATTGFVAELARPHSHRAIHNVLCPEPGDVLLNSTGTGTIGRSVVFDALGTFIVDGHVTVMRPRAEVADSRWLNSVLRTPWLQRHLERFCYSGSTNQLELNRTPLRESRLPTPHIEEQRRIAQILDTLDTAIHETEAFIAKLKALKQGLLHDLLTRGIDDNGELRPPQSEAPHLYKESPLGWIPKDWEAKAVREMGEAITGCTPPSHDPLAWGAGLPFVTPGDIDGDSMVASTERHVSVRGQRYVRVLPSRTTLVVCIGSTIGKVGITSVEACTNQQINAVLPGEGTDNEFLFHALQMHANQLRALAGLQAVPIVNKSSFESVLVPCPAAREQVEISRRVLVSSRRLMSEQTLSEKLTRQKAGLMDDLLTGRVRVTPLLAATTA